MKLCVPLFGPLREDRQVAWDACRGWWEKAGVEIVLGTGESRAAARNDAARNASGNGPLLFADADTVVPREQLLAAAERAEETDSLVLAFDVLYRLQRGTPLTNRPSGFQVRDCSNGVIAVGRELWERVGGFDERFTTWGGEDRAFLYACTTLQDEPTLWRVPGYALHHWHRAAIETRDPRKLPLQLALRYKAAAGRVEREGPLRNIPGAVRNRGVMEALLREEGGPRYVVA